MMKSCKSFTLILAGLLLLCCITIPASAQSGNHVYDEAVVLTTDTFEDLEVRASELSAQYGVGIYIATVVDYQSYVNYGDAWDCAKELFTANDFGIGTERNGVFLLLSMRDRSYGLAFHGSKAETAFTENGRDRLVDRMIGRFSNDDFAGGMSIYLDTCAEFLSAAEQGEPVGYGQPSYEDEEGFHLGIFVIIPGLIAALITGLVLNGSMKSSGIKRDADTYIADRLNLYRSSDMFLHRSVTRVPRQTSSSNHSSSHGGTHRSGGGFSGRSGKF